VGSVQIESSRVVEGVLIFAGAELGLAGVPSSRRLETGFLTPAQTSTEQSILTGIAVQGLEQVDVTLLFELLDPNGEVIASSDGTRNDGGSSVGLLQGRSQFALFLSQLVWTPEVDFTNFHGTLRVTVDGPVGATAIQTRPGLFATLPVILP
jgi:hypothetical protein